MSFPLATTFGLLPRDRSGMVAWYFLCRNAQPTFKSFHVKSSVLWQTVVNVLSQFRYKTSAAWDIYSHFSFISKAELFPFLNNFLSSLMTSTAVSIQNEDLKVESKKLLAGELDGSFALRAEHSFTAWLQV